MNRPRLIDYFVGNPVAFVVFGFFGVMALYRLFVGHLSSTGELLLIVPMLASIKARARLKAYAEWRRAWDSADGRATVAAVPRWKRHVIAVACIVPTAYLYAQRGDFGEAPVFAWLGACLLMAVIYVLIRIWRRRAGRSQVGGPAVSITVRRPLLAVPSLQAAYRLLPPHCASIQRRSSATTLEGGAE